MKNLELIDLTINLQHFWEDGTPHLIKVHMSPLEGPSLIGMFEVWIVEDKTKIGEFWHAGMPDVASAKLFAQKALKDKAFLPGLGGS